MRKGADLVCKIAHLFMYIIFTDIWEIDVVLAVPPESSGHSAVFDVKFKELFFEFSEWTNRLVTARK